MMKASLRHISTHKELDFHTINAAIRLRFLCWSQTKATSYMAMNGYELTGHTERMTKSALSSPACEVFRSVFFQFLCTEI